MGKLVDAAEEVEDFAERVIDELKHDLSLVRTFLRSLSEGGWMHALQQVGRKVALLAVPLGEVVFVGIAAFIVYSLIHHKDAKKHSAILEGKVSPEREPPRDIMKPHFFQNKQGLWIHHGLWWNEEKYGPARGLVVLFHGHSEHSKRFAHVAEHMNEEGLAVFGMDHQGFGRSEGDRGHVERFEDYVEDVLDFLQQVVYDDHPEWQHLPRFLAAHSMGSLITIHAALRCQSSNLPGHKLNGIMLSAPALKVDPARNTWYLRLAGKVLDVLTPKAQIISFPSYPSTSFLQVKFHATFDPLNYHGAVRVHQGLELLRGTQMALDFAPAFQTPILVVHGTEDLHADISGSRAFMSMVSGEDKTLLELPGIRHEPWQEERKIRDPILNFVARWAVDRLQGKPRNSTDLSLLEEVEFRCNSIDSHEQTCRSSRSGDSDYVKID